MDVRPTLRFDAFEGKYVYLATDFHLGSPDWEASLAREVRVVRWLQEIAPTAQAVFLLGDTFDFWFDYKTVAPKGFVRLLGAIARLTDAGVAVYLFTGNHDMWMFDYLPKACGVRILREPTAIILGGKNYLLGHGDGLGPGQYIYKVQKWFFASPVCQWLFGWIHPDVGIGIAHAWSGQSRKANAGADADFKGNAEHIWQWCIEEEGKAHHDGYVLGHRHLPLFLPVGAASVYINLGDWFGATAYYGRIGSKKLSVLTTNHVEVNLLYPPFAREGYVVNSSVDAG